MPRGPPCFRESNATHTALQKWLELGLTFVRLLIALGDVPSASRTGSPQAQSTSVTGPENRDSQVRVDSANSISEAAAVRSALYVAGVINL